VPWRITLKDGEPFAFAGVWERWEGTSDCVPVESCAIITTAANQLLRSLHYRMPVILSPESYPAWLGNGSTWHSEQMHRLTKLPKRPKVGAAEIRRNLLALLKPYPAHAMRAYQVSTAVNNVQNDGPECIEPVD
jgi:putative SOS response-associated peptidase YedK